MATETFRVASTTVPLVAATETDLIGTANVGVSTTATDSMHVLVSNTGANAIGTINVYASPVSSGPGAVLATTSNLLAGTSTVVTVNNVASSYVRVTATSTLGSQVTVEARGVRFGGP